MILISSANYKVKVEGYVKPFSTKLGREVTIANDGTKKESYLRLVDEYILNINRCTENNYNKLRTMFKKENLFEVKDTAREIEDGGLFFDLDSIELSDSENKKDKNFLYSGNLTASKL